MRSSKPIAVLTGFLALPVLAPAVFAALGAFSVFALGLSAVFLVVFFFSAAFAADTLF